MILVEPMHSELGTAHAGRIAHLNGLGGLNSLRRATIDIKYRPKGSDYTQQFEVLAHRLNIDPETYLARHSLIPFSFAYLRRRNVDYKNYRETVANSLAVVDGPLTKCLRFCITCVHDDTSSTGICWWRREHHIPGIDICVHHSEPLWRVDDGRAEEKLPNHYLKFGAHIEEETPDHRHEVIVRYRTIANFFLNRSIASSTLYERVRQRCSELGISRKICGNYSRSLSRHVRSQFPTEWLRKHHRFLTTESYAGRDLDIDSAFVGQGASGCTITMIITSLFSSIDDLIAEQTSTSMQLPDIKLATTWGDPRTSVKAFIRHFVAAGGKHDCAAITMSCSPATVQNLRRKFGIPKLAAMNFSARTEAIRRLLFASEKELCDWGFAMNRHWKQSPADRNRYSDIERFLIISQAHSR